MNLETFQNLPTSEVAKIVRTIGPKACAFPTDGTRRWFMLEHPAEAQKNKSSSYLDIMVPIHLKKFRLFFEYGIEILLEPMLGTGLLDRGQAYVETIPGGFSRLIHHPEFKKLCDDYEVQVRFYGDYHRVLANSPYAEQAEMFDEYAQALEEQTGKYEKHRLLIGIYPDESTESVANFAVRYYQAHGIVPPKKEIITAYYGEYLTQVDMFIGSIKPSIFGLPLLATDSIAYYFTINPSLYFTEKQLRALMFDYIYVRKGQKENYEQMQSEDWAFMRTFYELNKDGIIGVGRKLQSGNIWYPLPQVVWPLEKNPNLPKGVDYDGS